MKKIIQLKFDVLFLIVMFQKGCTNFTPDEGHFSTHYIYIDVVQYSWHEARELCSSLNASLFTMTSFEDYGVYRTLQDTSWNGLSNDEFWIGLIIKPYGIFWSDCTPLDYNFTHFKNDADSTYEVDKECYRSKPDKVQWEKKPCGDANAVLCEQKLQGNNCNLTTIIRTEMKSLLNLDNVTCHKTCQEDAECWSVISFYTNQCLLLRAMKTENPGVIMAWKNCFTGELHTAATDFITPEANAADTAFECSVTPTTDYETVVPSIVYQPFGTCSPEIVQQTVHVTNVVTVTNNVTQTEQTTVYTSVPHTLPVTVSVVDTIHVTVPTTQMILSTITQTEQTTIYTTVPNTLPVTVSVMETMHVTKSTTQLVLSTVTFISTVVSVTSNAPCSQHTTYVNVTDTHYIQDSLKNISKALYLNKKTTNSYQRTLSSASDDRTSSAYIGLIGICSVAIPLCVLFLVDLKRISSDVLETCRAFKE